MCPPGFLQAISRGATRRGLIARGLSSVAMAAAASPALAADAPTGSPRKPGPAASTRTFSHVLDLSHTLYEGFPTFDGSKWFSMEAMYTFGQDKLNINRWTLVEHTGTHMDAPLHFTSDGHSADEIPITDLIVPAAVINIAERAQENPDTGVTPDDIKLWEAKNGPLPDGCCVIMNSGWHHLLETRRFAGRDEAGKNHCPGFHGETAHMLIIERNVKGLGVDTLSLDLGLNTGPFPTHYAWLGSGRWGVECLANLDDLPPKGAYLVLGGPKVKRSTGGLTRVMALV
ncbi:MAG: cyclase family protein [Acetobacteraceae bacterium]|nr:cyclase family protein [Acetobacteraceae bacterium]